MDTQTYNIDGDRIPMQTSEAQFKDAMRYRKLKFFVDTLVIMDKHKGAMHFEKYEELDAYIDTLKISNGPLTAKDITAHALDILSNQLAMTHKESRK
jgi:hypothetical protein